MRLFVFALLAGLILSPAQAAEDAIAAVDDQAEKIIGLADAIWGFAEVG